MLKWRLPENSRRGSVCPGDTKRKYVKPNIHPAYNQIRVMCACGNSFTTRSTHKGDIHLEICSNCHPFFTGKQKLVDTAGRVERFRRKYAKSEQAGTKTGTK